MIRLLVFSLLPILMSAQTVKFSIGDWEPYVGQMLGNYGPTTKIVDTACQRAGFTCAYEFHPWKRSLDMAKRNYEDIMASFPWTEQSGEMDKIFSDSIR